MTHLHHAPVHPYNIFYLMLIIIRYDDHVFVIFYIDASGSRDGAVVRALASHSDSG